MRNENDEVKELIGTKIKKSRIKKLFEILTST
jgi:hypothetical protein